MKNDLLLILVISSNPPNAMTEQLRYCERNRERCLEKSRKYYDENRACQQKMAHDENRESSKAEKDRKGEYARNRYWNMSEEDRKILGKHRKNRICCSFQKELRQTVEQLKPGMIELRN